MVLSKAIADHLCLAITEYFNCSRITAKMLDNLCCVLKRKVKNNVTHSELVSVNAREEEVSEEELN